MAMNAAGDAVIVFAGYGPAIRAEFRPADGAFGGGVFGEQLSTGEFSDAEAPAVAINEAGEAIAVWQQNDESGHPRIYTSYRPVGGPWTTSTPISAEGATAPAVAIDADGDTVVLWLLNDGVDEIVQAVAGAHGSHFSTPAALTGDGGNAASVDVTMDGTGDAVATWIRTTASVSDLEYALAPAGESFPAPDVAGDGSVIGESEPGTSSIPPEPPVQDVAIDGSAEAIATWRTKTGDVNVARLGSPDSGFGAPSTLGGSAARPSAAINGAGESVVAWPVAGGLDIVSAPPNGPFATPTTVSSLDGKTPEDARVALAPDGTVSAVSLTYTPGPEKDSGIVAQEGMTRPPGAGFEPVKGLYTSGALLGAQSLELGSDGAGDVFGTWQRNTSIGDDIETINYDVGPLLGEISAPLLGQTGDELAFSVPPPISLWAPLETVRWSFGDGASAEGLTTSHTYTSPGVYEVSVTATNADVVFGPFDEHVNNSETRLITITAPPRPAAAAPVAPPTITPTIAKARQSHRVWRERAGTASSDRHRKTLPVGTTFSFSLDEPATVTLAFTQAAKGREVKGSCVPATKADLKSRPCERTTTLGTLVSSAAAGTNRVFFAGRISRGRLLKPGRYELVISATNAAGRRSAPASLAFTIAK